LACQYLICFSVCLRIFFLAGNLCFSSDVIVQGHRGNIIEGIGCSPTTYNVTLAYPLVYTWPPVISFIAVVYGCLAFRGFLKMRKTLDARFNSESHMDKGYYLRLMGFSLIPLFFMLPLSLYILIANLIVGPRPWISWEDTHLSFNRFDRFPAAPLEADLRVYSTFVVNIWGNTLCWVLFVIFLGMGPAHRKQYRRWFFSILRPIGIKPPSSPVDSPWRPEEITGVSTTHTKSISILLRYYAPEGSKSLPEKLDLTSVREDRVIIIGFDRNENRKGTTEKFRGNDIV
jgi:hypothetical protein